MVDPKIMTNQEAHEQVAAFYAAVNAEWANIVAAEGTPDGPRAQTLLHLCMALERAYPVPITGWLLTVGVMPGPNLEAAITTQLYRAGPAALQAAAEGATSEHSSTVAPAEGT